MYAYLTTSLDDLGARALMKGQRCTAPAAAAGGLGWLLSAPVRDARSARAAAAPPSEYLYSDKY